MDEPKQPRETLNPPSAFTAPTPAGQPRLIPPSHFESRLPQVPALQPPGLWTANRMMAPLPPPTTLGTDPWASLTKATKDLQELRQENEYLKEAQRTSHRQEGLRGRGRPDLEEANARARSLDRNCGGDQAAHRHALDISKQAEIISQQIRDIHRLEAESSGLRVLSGQQAAQLQKQEEMVCRLQEELKLVRAQLGRSEAQRALEAEKATLTHQAELERLLLQGRAKLERLEGQLTQERDQAQAEIESRRAELEVAVERHRREAAELSEEIRAMVEMRERDRLKQEERLQEQLQVAERQLQVQLSAASEAHEREVATLQESTLALEQDLRRERQEGRQVTSRLQQELTASKEENEKLTERLSKASLELDSQDALVQQLRTYIGELVPDNSRTEEWRRERENFVSTVQHLERERTALRTTTELLNVRLSSLTDILSIQELELSKKARLDALDADAPALLTCWRKKVFALMVQLKSQEINQENDARQICSKMSELEEELEARGQKQAVLLHSLQDKTAQLDMERVSHKALQEELSRTQAGASRAQHRAEQAEDRLQQLCSIVGSFHEAFVTQESGVKAALARLGSLGQRLSFASKRVDTIQGLVARKVTLVRLQLEEQSRATGAGRDSGRPSYEELQEEVGLLHQERDRLSAELKRSAQIIARKVGEARDKADAELRDQQAVLSQLQEALEEKAELQRGLMQRLLEAQEQKQEVERDLKQLLREAEAELQQSHGSLEELKQRLAGLQGEYQQALQEKVSEAEAHMLQQLAEMEKRVQEVRREHTKAVVALRQAERQTARDKERTQEMVKLQEEAHQRESQRLRQQLQELERDRNLLTATLRQEGLLNQHKKNRLPALQLSDALRAEPPPERPPTPLLPEAGAPRPGIRPHSKESLSAMLDNLQSLSAAIISEEEEVPTEEEEEG